MIVSNAILFVHCGRSLGGAPKALRYIIQSCTKAGYSCFVACLESVETNSYFRDAGAEVIIVEALPQFANSTTISYKQDSQQYKDDRVFAEVYSSYWKNLLYKYGPFSLVFINSMFLCDLIKPSQDAGCKVIQVIRETAQKGPLLDLMKAIIGEAERVLFISEYDRDLFSLKHGRFVVIPDAVDPDYYHCTPDDRMMLREKLGIEDSQFVLLFTGGYHYIKGGELLLRSLHRLKHMNICLIYAGYSPDVSSNNWIKSILINLYNTITNTTRYSSIRMARMLSELSSKSAITVKKVGYCKNIHEYFKISNLCVVPYAVPHQAMPIFEAGMASIPCLASDFDCFQYEITNGDNGYLLPASSPAAWARTITELSLDGERRNRMGLSNYHRAIKRHSISQNSQKILELIENVIRPAE